MKRPSLDIENLADKIYPVVHQVTARDVEHAATIAQIIGEHDQLDVGLPSCLPVDGLQKKHDCPSCTHFRTIECDHRNEWDCIASAIGASQAAVDLWMKFSNILHTTQEDRDLEVKDAIEHDEPARRDRYYIEYAWAGTLFEGCSRSLNELVADHDELEIAALLRDGHLPPGWELVKRRTRPYQRPEDLRDQPTQMPAPGPCTPKPLVVVNMSNKGPVQLGSRPNNG